MDSLLENVHSLEAQLSASLSSLNGQMDSLQKISKSAELEKADMEKLRKELEAKNERIIGVESENMKLRAIVASLRNEKEEVTVELETLKRQIGGERREMKQKIEELSTSNKFFEERQNVLIETISKLVKKDIMVAHTESTVNDCVFVDMDSEESVNGERRKDMQDTQHSEVEKRTDTLVSIDNSDETIRQQKIVVDKISSLLTNISPINQIQTIEQFLSFNVSEDPHILSHVVDALFGALLMKPELCPIYAHLCKAQVKMDEHHLRGRSPFKDAVLFRSQAIFVRRSDVQLDQRNIKLKAIEEEILLTQLADEDKDYKMSTVNIMFMCQLFIQQLLSLRVIHWCVIDLLRGTDDSHISQWKLDHPLLILETVGHLMEPQEKMNGFYKHLESLKDKVSENVGVRIVELVEMRNREWRNVPIGIFDQNE